MHEQQMSWEGDHARSLAQGPVVPVVRQRLAPASGQRGACGRAKELDCKRVSRMLTSAEDRVRQERNLT